MVGSKCRKTLLCQLSKPQAFLTGAVLRHWHNMLYSDSEQLLWGTCMSRIVVTSMGGPSQVACGSWDIRIQY
eukprot:1136163-Amphidinium_carterae.1